MGTAKVLAVTEARVSDIERGRLSSFSLDLLVRLAASPPRIRHSRSAARRIGPLSPAPSPPGPQAPGHHQRGKGLLQRICLRSC